MRDAMKMTVRYQFMYIMLMQLMAIGILLVFGLVAFWYFLDRHIIKEIISIVFMGVDFAILYTTSKKLANRDYKPYTPLKPSIVKGLLFGVMISAVTAVLIAAYVYVWANFSSETGINGVIPTIINVIFYCWTFPYTGIMGLYSGHFTIISAIAMIILPPAATLTGYIAGGRNFEFTEKLDKFMYEKE